MKPSPTTKGQVTVTNVDKDLLERLDRLEIAVGQLATAAYGPSVGGSSKTPLIAGFVAQYERRRDEQHRQARAAQAQRELAEIERVA